MRFSTIALAIYAVAATSVLASPLARRDDSLSVDNFIDKRSPDLSYNSEDPEDLVDDPEDPTAEDPSDYDDGIVSDCYQKCSAKVGICRRAACAPIFKMCHDNCLDEASTKTQD